MTTLKSTTSSLSTLFINWFHRIFWFTCSKTIMYCMDKGLINEWCFSSSWCFWMQMENLRFEWTWWIPFWKGLHNCLKTHPNAHIAVRRRRRAFQNSIQISRASTAIWAFTKLHLPSVLTVYVICFCKDPTLPPRISSYMERAAGNKLKSQFLQN